MSKSRSFSIYLLKDGFDHSNALKEDHKLDDNIAGEQLPEGATLFILDNPPAPPWWKDYFSINQELWQTLKGAIVFLPVEGRTFAITFGHVFHNLKDVAYEYDFGLRVTLNCLDPDKLKSTDVVQADGARRQRTQVPVDSDLTYFDFDQDTTILKSLTGKVKEEHKKLFKHATGSSNIRISSDVTPAGLNELCEELLSLYNDDGYKDTFPDIQNISPVRDPEIIERLNAALLEAVQEKSDSLALTVPEILDYRAGLWATFSGAGGGLIYDDVFIDRYYEYLDDNEIKLDQIDIEALKKHNLVLTDEDGKPKGERHSLFKCLIFDVALDDEHEIYHLCDGSWYLIDADFVGRLSTFLDELCSETVLPQYQHENEGDYNEKVAAASKALVCLDRKSIAPDGEKAVEPCDIYELRNGTAILHHVKISTLSAQLSHLFNQGTNSARLLRSADESKEKFKRLLEEEVGEEQSHNFTTPLDANNFEVIFEIITHKDAGARSQNLPLFSRISLMRAMKDLRLWNIPAAFCFIRDETEQSAGKKKKRKPRGKNNPDPTRESSSDDDPIGMRPGLGACPGEALGDGVEIVSPIEAVGEAGEIALGMFRADMMIGAGDRRFDVAEHGVHPFERRPPGRLPA